MFCTSAKNLVLVFGNMIVRALNLSPSYLTHGLDIDFIWLDVDNQGKFQGCSVDNSNNISGTRSSDNCK